MQFTAPDDGNHSAQLTVHPEAQATAPVSMPPPTPSPAYTKLEMQWNLVDGKLVCAWRQQPD